MLSEELKSCPCYGDEAYLYTIMHDSGEFVLGYSIGCLGCDLETWRYDTKEEAISAWNKRVNK